MTLQLWHSSLFWRLFWLKYTYRLAFDHPINLLRSLWTNAVIIDLTITSLKNPNKSHRSRCWGQNNLFHISMEHLNANDHGIIFMGVFTWKFVFNQYGRYWFWEKLWDMFNITRIYFPRGLWITSHKKVSKVSV